MPAGRLLARLPSSDTGVRGPSLGPWAWSCLAPRLGPGGGRYRRPLELQDVVVEVLNGGSRFHAAVVFDRGLDTFVAVQQLNHPVGAGVSFEVDHPGEVPEQMRMDEQTAAAFDRFGDLEPQRLYALGLAALAGKESA